MWLAFGMEEMNNNVTPHKTGTTARIATQTQHLLANNLVLITSIKDGKQLTCLCGTLTPPWSQLTKMFTQ